MANIKYKEATVFFGALVALARSEERRKKRVTSYFSFDYQSQLLVRGHYLMYIAQIWA